MTQDEDQTTLLLNCVVQACREPDGGMNDHAIGAWENAIDWLRKRGELVLDHDGRVRILDESMSSPPPLATLQLSPHFSLAEMVKSQTADRLDLHNLPTGRELTNLQALCTEVLEPIRSLVGKPVSINSGFRNVEVNRRIGGTGHSQHTTGEAADIEVAGVDNRKLALLIRDGGIPFDQLILEFYQDSVPRSGWVHVSHNANRAQRGQVLRAYRAYRGNGAVKYSTEV